MCFQSQPSGSLHSPLPNAPENNPTVFFPQLAGNDLTIARKRNVKHSLELFVTSEHRGGPCASASLDIPEHTQPKVPTAGVNCCSLAPTPKQSQKHSPTLPRKPLCSWREEMFFTSGLLLLRAKSWELRISNHHLRMIYKVNEVVQHCSISESLWSITLSSICNESVFCCGTMTLLCTFFIFCHQMIRPKLKNKEMYLFDQSNSGLILFISHDTMNRN